MVDILSLKWIADLARLHRGIWNRRIEENYSFILLHVVDILKDQACSNISTACKGRKSRNMRALLEEK